MSAGDTVLFMSDGFEEMFNPQDEMLGEEQVKMLFEETAAGPGTCRWTYEFGTDHFGFGLDDCDSRF